MFSAEPVCSCAAFLIRIAHETAGAARIRSSPRPLTSEGKVSFKSPGVSAPRVAKLRPLCFDIDFGNAQIGPKIRT